MEISKESPIEYAENLSEIYSNNYGMETRKFKGQFFTSKQVSKYMVSLFKINQNKISLLDPGAGTGVLTAAFCERLLKSNKIVNLTIDLYENDLNLIPFLKKTLDLCKFKLEKNGCLVKYNIHKQDFILNNGKGFNKSNLFSDKKYNVYDFIISNPPYFKISKDSLHSIAMEKLIFGQPNIYALFMAVAANMLKPKGEMVFITPRSFCSGLYYKKFREWLLNNVQITNIHIFESRKDVFDKDKVLQENIIIKAKKGIIKSRNKQLTLSVTKDKSFNNLKCFKVQENNIFYHRNGDTYIRVPTSLHEVNILETVDTWPNTLKDLGLEISTGPVVPFRTKEYLIQDIPKPNDSAPLLWMHNVKCMNLLWPLAKNKKYPAICICDKTKHILLPVKNYVLIKRFASKEQKRRLCSAVLLGNNFPYKIIGIENHLNYIYKINDNLSTYEAFGIAVLLNTTIADVFFRSLNGSTQVNATDIRNLPFPKLKDIIRIGKLFFNYGSNNDQLKINSIVSEVLGISIKNK